MDAEYSYKIDETNLKQNLQECNIFDSEIIHFQDEYSNPKDIIIWEQTPNHYVQILFMLKEESGLMINGSLLINNS